MVTLLRRGSSPSNLDVLALALVTLQSDAGQAAQSVCDIRIGQAGDDLNRQNLKNVVRRAGPVDGLSLAVNTLGRHVDLFDFRGDLQTGIQACDLAGDLAGRHVYGRVVR